MMLVMQTPRMIMLEMKSSLTVPKSLEIVYKKFRTMAFLEMTYFFGWMKIMNVKMNASQGLDCAEPGRLIMQKENVIYTQ